MKAEVTFNGAILCFYKIAQALDMETKFNISKLVVASLSVAALASLKSAVLTQYTISSWARDKLFHDLYFGGRRPMDLL